MEALTPVFEFVHANWWASLLLAIGSALLVWEQVVVIMRLPRGRWWRIPFAVVITISTLLWIADTFN